MPIHFLDAPVCPVSDPRYFGYFSWVPQCATLTLLATMTPRCSPDVKRLTGDTKYQGRAMTRCRHVASTYCLAGLNINQLIPVLTSERGASLLPCKEVNKPTPSCMGTTGILWRRVWNGQQGPLVKQTRSVTISLRIFYVKQHCSTLLSCCFSV